MYTPTQKKIYSENVTLEKRKSHLKLPISEKLRYIIVAHPTRPLPLITKPTPPEATRRPRQFPPPRGALL